MGLAIGLPVAGRAQEQTPQGDPDAPKQGRIDLPPLPKVEDVRMPGERGFSLGVYGWGAKAKIGTQPGAAVNVENPGGITASHAVKPGQILELAIATGAHNMLRITATNMRGNGSAVTPQAFAMWTAAYNKGDYIRTSYRLRNLKIAFDYLSWPFPVKKSRIRVHSIWQVQATNLKVGYNAPFEPTTDSDGNEILDDAGNPVVFKTDTTKSIIQPGVGFGVQGYLSRRVSLDMRAVGFALPHRSNYWDAEAAANFRFGHYELRLGARGFHFRTTPRDEFWLHGTAWGPMVGLRWHSDSDQPSSTR